MYNTIETTILFWDCECKDDYIHPKRRGYCHKCKATSEEQPDSRVNEALLLLDKLLLAR